VKNLTTEQRKFGGCKLVKSSFCQRDEKKRGGVIGEGMRSPKKSEKKNTFVGEEGRGDIPIMGKGKRAK